MRTANISNLKARLSAHLQYFRGGKEVVVVDRHQPVARIVPIRAEGFTEDEKRLVAGENPHASREGTIPVPFMAGATGEHFR